MFSVSQVHNVSRQYYYLFKFRGLIRWYIVLVLSFLQKKSFLLPTYYEIRGLVGSQNGANIHSLVPTSLQDTAINLYMSVVDFIYFCRLVESPLQVLSVPATPQMGNQSAYGRWPEGSNPGSSLRTFHTERQSCNDDECFTYK